MKKRNLLVSIIALFTLSGCDFIDNILARFKQPQKQEETSENEEQKKEENKEQEQNPPIPKTKIGEFYGGVVEGDTYHEEYFKTYYGLQQDVKLNFYYLPEYTEEAILHG